MRNNSPAQTPSQTSETLPHPGGSRTNNWANMAPPGNWWRFFMPSTRQWLPKTGRPTCPERKISLRVLATLLNETFRFLSFERRSGQVFGQIGQQLGKKLGAEFVDFQHFTRNWANWATFRGRDIYIPRFSVASKKTDLAMGLYFFAQFAQKSFIYIYLLS